MTEPASADDIYAGVLSNLRYQPQITGVSANKKAEIQESYTPTYGVQVILRGHYEPRDTVRDTYDFSGHIRLVDTASKKEDGTFATVLAEANLDHGFLGSTSFHNDEKQAISSDSSPWIYVMIKWSYEMGQSETRNSLRASSQSMDSYNIHLVARMGSTEWSHDVKQSFHPTQNHNMHNEFTIPLQLLGQTVPEQSTSAKDLRRNFHSLDIDDRSSSVDVIQSANHVLTSDVPVRAAKCIDVAVPLVELGVDKGADVSTPRIRENLKTFKLAGNK